MIDTFILFLPIDQPTHFFKLDRQKMKFNEPFLHLPYSKKELSYTLNIDIFDIYSFSTICLDHNLLLKTVRYAQLYSFDTLIASEASKKIWAFLCISFSKDSIREGEILVGWTFWCENSTGVRQNHNILSGVSVDSLLFSMGPYSATRFQWGEWFIYWGEKMGHFWKYFSLGWRVGWISLGHRDRGVIWDKIQSSNTIIKCVHFIEIST